MVSLLGVPSIPLVGQGNDLAALICRHAAENRAGITENDVVVVAQKILSKAEGPLIELRNVVPSARARELAELTQKEPRLVEVVLSETDHVLRAREGVLIVEHRLGSV
jgi:coenzyme F420-0:L-glutamate ligase/coenzyme F420-1:gamma-L-glutamate ligase